MKKHFLSFLLFIPCIFYTQVKETDYFKFFNNDTKRLKPIKYILFDPFKDKKITTKNKVVYFIEEERFVFINVNKIDTTTIDFLKKVKIENVAQLANDEIQFFRNTIPMKKFDEVGVKPPFPIVKSHPFFKIFLLEKTNDNKFIKKEVVWEFTNNKY